LAGRERAICARVKQFRRQIKWPQPAFAKELGISRDQLANVEYGRAPLRMALGTAICRVFEVNGEWLATGQGIASGSSPMLWTLQHDPDWYSRLFSDAYDRNPELFLPTSYAPRYPLAEPTPGFDPQAFLIKEILRWFQANQFKTPLAAENFAREISDYAGLYLEQMRKTSSVIRPLPRPLPGVAGAKTGAAGTQAPLDKVAKPKAVGGGPGGIGSLPELLQAVRDRAGGRGQKAALARRLGVSRQAVEQWLSGAAKPSAELTFKLLNWVGGGD
jgi:transcriptional regulator with XRE-family HTH domain